VKNAFPLFIFIITGIGACFGQPLNSGSVSVSPTFGLQGIQIVTIADPAFTSKLGSLLPAAIVSELTPLLPYLVLIENHSQTPITKTTVQYERTTPAGLKVYGWSSLNTTAPGAALGPGASLIQAPRSDLSQVLFAARAGNPPNPGVAAAMSAQIISGLFDPRRATSTVVSMDSVIFSSGGVVGPDNFDLLGQAEASAEAMSDIAARASDDSVPDRVLDAWLQRQATQSMALVEQPDGKINHTLLAQISAARAMQSVLATQGRAVLKARVSAVDHTPQLFRLEQ